MSEPRQVFLFSGHMVDGPGRDPPRFPNRMVPAARRAVGSILDEFGAGPTDRALCGGACGGDLIFAGEAQRRGVPVAIHLPFQREAFVEQSVGFAGSAWVDRFNQIVDHPDTDLHITDPTPAGPDRPDRFTRNNLALLERAHAPAVPVRFVALWDGQSGDGPGGTEHMAFEVSKRAGEIRIVDPGALPASP